MKVSKNYITSLILPGLILVLATVSNTQLSDGGTPQSFIQLSKSIINAQAMSPVDVEIYLAEDEIEEQEDLPFCIGTPHDVNYSLQNSGECEKLPDGLSIWNLRIVSYCAYSINHIYDNCIHPLGYGLFFYSEDRELILGAFIEKNNKQCGLFTNTPVKGDDITVKYYEPDDNKRRAHQLTKAIHFRV